MFDWVCLNAWKLARQKHNEWIPAFVSAVALGVCIVMSIKDHVCIAQGQAPGLMHCSRFTDDKSL